MFIGVKELFVQLMKSFALIVLFSGFVYFYFGLTAIQSVVVGGSLFLLKEIFFRFNDRLRFVGYVYFTFLALYIGLDLLVNFRPVLEKVL